MSVYPSSPYLHLRDPGASGETRDAPKHFALAKAPTTPSACMFGNRGNFAGVDRGGGGGSN